MPKRIHLLAKLRLARSMAEQQPEGVRVFGRRREQPRHTASAEPWGASRRREPIAGPAQHLSVEVRFGFEVPVEDDTVDTGLGGHILEAGRGKSCPCERVGGRDQDLLAAFRPWQQLPAG